MTSDQFEKGDYQNWSQKPQDPNNVKFLIQVKKKLSLKTSNFDTKF
jgi:hypothetical protein